MLLERVPQLVNMLNKIRVRVGFSVISEARTITKNEVFKFYCELKKNGKFNVEKFSQMRDYIVSLNKPFNPKISPFNPNDGFYVVDFERMNKGIKVFLRGQNIYYSTFCFVKFILKEVYDAHVKPANENFYLYCGNTIVGIGRLYEKERCIKVKIGEFLPYGKLIKHEQILVKFWQKNFLITNLIFCPGYVVEKLMPRLREKKEEYSTLLITRTKILLKALNKS
ncbi:MAG: hypothetical protein QXX41_04845 [Nitrososphaerota archaeon]